MAQTTLVPFTSVKEILNSLLESEIVQYDGAFCTQKSGMGSSDDEVSIVEVKIAFVKSRLSQEDKDKKSTG